MFKNRVVIISLIVLALALVVMGTVYYKSKYGSRPKTGTESELNNSQPQTINSNSLEAGTMPGNSFKSVFQSSNEQTKCDFLLNDFSGTAYIDGQKALFSYRDSTNGSIYYMIINGADAYVWKDGNSTGYKTTKDFLFSASPSKSLLPLGGIDPTSEVGLTCEPKQFNTIIFELPENIKFDEFKIN